MKPDDRKGKLRVCKATDGLNHLQWGGRAPDMPFLPEDDFIIFPQEAEMKFIPNAGHALSEPGISAELVKTTNALRRQRAALGL